jgi:hypothetical protein
MIDCYSPLYYLVLCYVEVPENALQQLLEIFLLHFEMYLEIIRFSPCIGRLNLLPCLQDPHVSNSHLPIPVIYVHFNIFSPTGIAQSAYCLV